MIRVLHIFHNMGNGGIEHFVMNFYRNIDRERVQFDYLTSVDEKGFFDDEIHELGGKTFRAFPFKKNPIKNYLDIARIVKENQYQIVHRHTGSAFGYFDLRAARRGGAKTLILHSHASSAGNGLLHRFSNRFLKIPCEKFACAREAGQFLFGSDASFEIINNAIDTQLYCFDPQKREALRQKYGVSENIVLGHVGAFYPVKNHSFILDVFCALHKINDKYRLWLVGDGEQRIAMEQKARDLGIAEYVHFWGNRKDVADLLQAMDQFILPSFHEGLNISTIEAYSTGLPCIVSNSCTGFKGVSAFARDGSNMTFLALSDGADAWARHMNTAGGETDRTVGCIQIKAAGFDIKDAAADLERRYLLYAER